MLREILLEEIPDLDDFAASLSDLPIDSFGMVVLRSRIEQALGHTVSDDTWCTLVTPNDILALGEMLERPGTAPLAATAVTERRFYSINMPQMAISGLSESWLFRELGDLHWSLITTGLKSPSASLKDGNGNRLYATFTRIRYSLGGPLSKIGENERLGLRGSISRIGAGTFISDVAIEGEAGERGSARMMSNFSRRDGTSNISLLKGQPDIPEGCAIPETEPGAFDQDYRTRRRKAVAPATFECEYEIVPFHDINGVGLLYFAAYPIISDICAMKSRPEIATRFSTTSRDVYYFANAEPSDTLIFRVHKWEQTLETVTMETSLSRKSDGLMMAYMLTGKAQA